MNALDQAFFKAYMHQGTASMAMPLASARPVQFEEVLTDRPDRTTAAAARKTSLDSVLAALARPPARPESAAPPPKASPDEVDDGIPVARGPAPTLPRQGSKAGKPAPKEQARAKAAPTLAELGLPESSYRVDEGESPAPTMGGDSRLVHPPHLSLVTPEIGDDMADTAADEPTDFGGVRSARAGTGMEAFRPMLQVDRFTWPRTCSRLMTAAAGELDRLGDELLAVQARGQKVLAIAGCRRGEGSTTMLLCIARRLAERGLRVVMVDADLADPQLARQLGVLPQFGWESVWAGRLPLAEVVIESAENRLALLPLREAFAPAGPWTDGKTIMAESIGTLAANFDLVLVDWGPLEDPAVLGGSFGREVSRRLDGVLLVQNVRVAARERLAEIHRRLAAAGIAQTGIIENLVRN